MTHKYNCVYWGDIKFKGQDGSLGFRKDKVYKVQIFEMGLLDRIFLGAKYLLVDTNGGLRCPYRSWRTIRNNWSINF